MMREIAARWHALRPGLERLALPAILCLAAALFLLAHARHSARPASDSLSSGWWTWSDQGHYLTAARALARLDLAPGQHWYEPAYSALAAPFVHVTPADPFLIPDLAAYLLSCWLLGALGARLFGAGWGRPLGAALFVAATAASPAASAIWVVPWTTTPVAPLVLGGLAAILAFADRPRPGTLFVSALCAVGVGAFRPADVLVVTLPAGLLALRTLASSRLPARQAAAIVAAGLAGGLLPAAAGIGLHVAIWGWSLSPYLQLSRGVGLDWALIPVRWVLIVVGPQPMLTEGMGLAEAFSWIVFGTAGMAACLTAPGRVGRVPHMAVIGAAAVQCALLLAYRDLHPTGLWRFNNYHYFKWLIPTFALYAALLAQALADRARRARAAIVAAAAAIGLFCWRPELDPANPALHAEVEGTRQLTLLSGTRSLADALLVAARGRVQDLLVASYLGTGPDRIYLVNDDFKAYPRPGGFLFVPLHLLPAGLVVSFPAGITFSQAVTPIGVRERTAFKLPCWFGPCPAPDLLPGWPLAVGQPLAMDDDARTYLAGDWADAEPGGRWTDGRDAGVLARVAGAVPGQDLLLRVHGHGYVPAGSSDPARVAVLANGREIALWRPEAGPDRDLLARIPAGDLGADGALRLEFRVENPRSPASAHEGTDQRQLGLFVQSLSLDTAAPD